MIKRSFCIILVIIFMLMPVSLVSAQEIAQSSMENSTKGSVDVSCVYDEKNARINISGTVSHDLLVSHKDHTVQLYKLDALQSFEEAMAGGELLPIAESDISIKVSFSVSVSGIQDVFSKYVIVIVSEDDGIEYVSPEVYPSVESKYHALLGNKMHYKGIGASADFSSVKGVPSLVVLDIDINEIQSLDFMGYLYTVDGRNVFFNRDYIDELDSKIRTLATNKTAVYFRLVCLDEKAESAIPDCSDIENMQAVYAVCDFLADRYNSHQYGALSGFIIGRSVDNAVRDASDEELGAYLDKLGLYTIVATNALRSNIPSADIVIPISDDNSYSSKKSNEQYGRGRAVIEGLCERFDRHYGDDFDFSLMLETSVTPYEINNTNIEPTVNFSIKPDQSKLATHNIGDFVLYLDGLDDLYSCAPKTFKYYWSADGDLSGNALACAYAYTYYKLFIQKTVSSFIVDFDPTVSAAERFADIYNIFKYIDTAEGEEQTSFLLSYFDIGAWGDIISPTFANHNLDIRTHIVSEPINTLPRHVVGKFQFFNYTEGSSSVSWYEGWGAKDVFVDYSSVVGRALRVEFESSGDSKYSYLMWNDVYPESYEYTPYLAFDFCIEGDGTEEKGLFEVRIEIGNGTNVVECTTAVMSKSPSRVIFDISEFSSEYLGDYIKIAVRPITDGNADYSLYLSSITGHSTELDDEELEEAIINSRTEIRNKDSLIESLGKNDNSRAVIITIAVIGVILGVMLFFFLRYDDAEEKRE